MGLSLIVGEARPSTQDFSEFTEICEFIRDELEIGQMQPISLEGIEDAEELAQLRKDSKSRLIAALREVYPLDKRDEDGLHLRVRFEGDDSILIHKLEGVSPRRGRRPADASDVQDDDEE